MVYVYKNTISTFSGWTIPSSCVEIDDETYAKLVSQELIWQDGEIISNPNYQQIVEEKTKEDARQSTLSTISELKANLTKTDYIAIKYAEGWITAEDYAETKAQRQAWRDQINELENSLTSEQ